MYYPNLKTSDAELRAVRFLDDDVKRKIIPIFELTRSRKTRNIPNGSIERRVEQLYGAYGKYCFILDLATQDDLINDQVISMFDESGGYRNWTDFLEKNSEGNIIPCVLYTEDGSKENFQKQIDRIASRYGKICLRTSVADEDASKLYRWACEVVDANDIITCGILYYIEPLRIGNYKELCRLYVERVIGNKIPGSVLFPGSSFPRYVTDREGCGDLKGKFEALELLVERDVQTMFSNIPIEPSDFASVHPIRYQTGGGNWIPRIDIFDGSSFIYVRSRRTNGGYDKAAQDVDRTLVSRLPESWGKTQIINAIDGKVTGGSPSFWISVRINCWITQRAK